ncbi:MAG: hypothetical protein QOI95_4424 [Acidimicrobiaceae bacterium]
MKVFVAGASGALGQALVPKLQACGHEVVALSRSERAVAAKGVECAVGDLLDAEGMRRVLQIVTPDVVVHAAKAIPKRGPLTYRDMRATNRLHDEATANLLNASRAAGARRFIGESIVFAYGYGDLSSAVITEDHPTRSNVPRPKLNEEIDGVLAMERHALEANAQGAIETVLLRCGLYYGPRAGTDYMATMLRRRMLPLPGGGRGLWPLVYIEDVADAIVLATIEGEPGGIYNVVDDQPVSLRDFVTELAQRTGGRPWSIPKRIARLFAPYFVEVATTAMRVSNARAKKELGWSPMHPTFRDGLDAWQAWSAATS